MVLHCPAEINIIWRGAYVALNLYIPFSIHSASQNMQAAHTVCNYAPPYYQRCWLLNWALITRWKVSLLFRPEDGVRDFQQEYQIWTCLIIEHFSTLKQSILNEPWPTGHDGASGPCSHMASLLHDRASVGICRWIVFTNSGFWKYSWAHLVISMTESCRWVLQCLRFLQFLWIFWWCYAL